MDPTAYTDSGTNASRDASAAWLMPELVTTQSPHAERDVTVPPGVVTQALTRNPRRIGIVFMLSVSTVDGTFVSSYPDPAVFGIPIPASTRIVSFAVDDLLSLVGEAWYIYHASGATVRVIEFVRPA